jgi:lipoate-protein ligase A
MAVDEALLCSFDSDNSEPVLRFYGWNPPALSLGRFQDAEDVLNLGRCRNDGVSIVRRVSGGGTIYHADELTYSIVCAPRQIQSATSVKDSFRVLTGFLIDFYRTLGLESFYAVDMAEGGERLGERTAFCFAGTESFDILIDGRKIGGNAQRRCKNIIFQHGSIPIINRAHHGLQYMKDNSPRYAENSVSLADLVISRDLSVLKSQLLESFSKHMGVAIRVDSLSPEEQHSTHQLMIDKYAADWWNLRGEVR